MPWNPAKLEQRVGRIDRIGQEAEKIKIFNMVNKSTIEDHIMAKLFERVKIFNCTLGPLGELLSKCQKEFRSRILDTNRSQEEKERYEKRILENLRLKGEEQQEFEKSQYEVFGALEFFGTDAVIKNLFISKEEIEFFWNMAIAELNGHMEQIEIKKGIYKIKASVTCKQAISGLLARCTELQGNFKKKDYYYSNIFSKLDKDLLLLTFDQKIAIDNHHIEFITLSHPLFKGLLESYLFNYYKQKQVLSFACNMPFLEGGEFLAFFYKFTFSSLSSELSDHVEEGILVYSAKTGLAFWIEDRTSFVQYLLKTSTKSQSIDCRSLAHDARNVIDIEKGKYSESLAQMYEERLLQDRLAKTSVITNSYNDQIGQVKAHLKSSHGQNVRRNYEMQVTGLEREMEEKIEFLARSGFRSTIKCCSILHLSNIKPVEK